MKLHSTEGESVPFLLLFVGWSWLRVIWRMRPVSVVPLLFGTAIRIHIVGSLHHAITAKPTR
ncbi:hypothetical protein J3F83DRAFT_757018 [Trichoderma novae-zelandiae]